MRSAWRRAAGAAGAVLVAATAGSASPLPTGGASAAQGVGSEQARGALLRIGDFPDGWKDSTATGSTTPTRVTRAVASCESASTAGLASGAPHATSPRFSQPSQSLTVTEAVSVYASDAAAAREYGVYSSSKAAGCLVSYLQQALDKHGGTSGVTTGQASGGAAPFPRYAGGTVAFDMTVPVSVKGFTGNVEVEAVVLHKGASLAYLTMTSIGSPFPVTLAHQLAAKATRRMRR